MDPKITANKLGEYLCASPRRRRSIIKTLQQEAPYAALHYVDARNSITSYMAGEITEKELIRRSEELKNFTSDKEFIVNTKRASGIAIEQFLDVVNDIVISKCIIKKGDDFESSHLEISGVKVTTKPDLIIMDEREQDVIGCIKFSFSQSAPLEENAAEYTATIMKKYLEEKLSNGVKIESKNVIVVDNPTGEVYEAPKSYKSRIKDIEAGCEEIAARWDK